MCFNAFNTGLELRFSVKHFDMEKLHHVFNYDLKGVSSDNMMFFSSNRFIKVHVDYQGRSNTFRPCPVFILTQLSPGWCGGVLTGVW